ncbi:MAG: hypothetical protein IAF58_06675 [Leptolyngbya sp.]|nr:hypothetical protein [Candidatus Melainabacteria bacterium]
MLGQIKELFPEIARESQVAADSFQKALFALFSGEGEQPSAKLTELLAKEAISKQEDLQPFGDWRLDNLRARLSGDVNHALSPLCARVRCLLAGESRFDADTTVSHSLYDMQKAYDSVFDVDEKLLLCSILENLEDQIESAQLKLRAKTWLSFGHTNSDILHIADDLKLAIANFRERMIGNFTL